VPFTIRAHSFDVLRPGGSSDLPSYQRDLGYHLGQNPGFLGLIAFPFQHDELERLGVPRERLLAGVPVVNFDLFYDRAKNSTAVMNTGALIPKKKMTDFVDLAAMVTSRRFNLYPLTSDSGDLQHYNQSKGGPVTIHPPRRMGEMPAAYKNSQWLAYTGCFETRTVGWPIAVAEAMAAGTGVCVAKVREDLANYVRDAGYLYESLEEAAEIIRAPLSAPMRERGFERARELDIRKHLPALTQIWQGAVRRQGQGVRAS
jgi:glycosyltransferase involved in cell wall biosynthesis